ncbi:hypothetical protein CRU87_09560 [Aliarcobacter trophiarum LMG 25534]|uniref:Lipoprotein n=1 Tax=Aliarcobacter trophiarum LMG 25534 TaxID=1032241 RepID=A0AAD0QHI2_9BACT|nr:hypothetical protein [Aliarcobacter trophiarum]AXK47977.1 hypothetical protein ATR_0084 [Aliarcobacter trophiarum LMG 25534]RXJ89309.1 hypothetical protein CRU87_09560 [Aliarcobacter trophiarum LMG 25534]
MLKRIILILLTLLFSSCAVNQKKVEIETKETINEELLSHIRYILYLFNSEDLKTLNDIYINKDFGYFDVSLDELSNKIVVEKRAYLEEIDNFIESFDIENREIFFNCSPYNDAFYGWSENGTFIFEAKSNYLENYQSNNTKELDNFIKKVKNSSFEVIATYNTIFYITKIDKKYYITLIDNYKTDCQNALIQAF